MNKKQKKKTVLFNCRIPLMSINMVRTRQHDTTDTMVTCMFVVVEWNMCVCVCVVGIQQKRQQNLNEFITRVTRDSRCAKLKLVQSFFFDSPQGRGANKVGDALPLGPESPDNTMFMDETMDPLEVRRASSACKIFVD